MKREILFRGRSWAGIWVEGYLSVEFGKTYIRHEWMDDSSPSGPAMISVEVDPVTVGQFTGLLDKNGNRIFEGDATKDPYTGRYFVVKFGTTDTENSVFYLCESGSHIAFRMRGVDQCDFFENIHDNPELLNQ